MFRIVYIYLCVVILFVRAKEEKEKVHVTPEKAVALGNEMMKCANEVGGEMTDMMEQFYSGNIKDEDKVKRFLFCFTKKQGFADSESRFVAPKILEFVGEFKSKDAFVKVIEECNKVTTGKDNMDKLFQRAKCIQSKTPAIITL